ncbi:MAG: hypothetical protein A2252_08875 [Elusimicrobia bacterium RIFOXYA2_FULL_39_19]|nr:MAG: hypothetical protein A2252_08875 [Elusimicrobia bacterium RIFOXYA2_FULL_39_19]
MIIFWRIVLAHFLTDFTLQTNRIAVWKRNSYMGVIVHSATFPLLAFIFCIFDKNLTGINFIENMTSTWWLLPGWVCILLMSFIHFAEDSYRIWSIKESGSPDNLIFFLWDQFIHLVTIFVLSPINSSILIPEKYVILLILIILITHFSTIFIYYLEQLFYGKENVETRLKGKYAAIAERLIIFGCFLLPGHFVFIGLGLYAIIRIFIYKPAFKFSYINIASGTLLAILLGYLSRVILY